MANSPTVPTGVHEEDNQRTRGDWEARPPSGEGALWVDLSLWWVRGLGYGATVKRKERTSRTYPGHGKAVMLDQDNPTRPAAFTQTAFGAVRGPRAKHGTTP